MTGSKSTSESGARQFGFTELEEELQGINLDLVKKQVEQIVKQIQFQDKAFQVLEPAQIQALQDQETALNLFSPEEERQRALDQTARQDRFASAEDELLRKQLDLVRQGPGATDEQRALINQATEAQLARGESDILNFSQRALEQISQELAPASGLRPTDTPIQDRAFRVGEEAARQQGSLVSELRGQQAQAELNFPIAANQSAAQIGQFQQNLARSSTDFAQQLQQQAFQNRLNLFGQTGQAGLGLIGSTQPQAQLQETFRPQIAATSESQTKSGGVSSSAKKHHKSGIDRQEILAAMETLPVERW